MELPTKCPFRKMKTVSYHETQYSPGLINKDGTESETWMPCDSECAAYTGNGTMHCIRLLIGDKN